MLARGLAVRHAELRRRQDRTGRILVGAFLLAAAMGIAAGVAYEFSAPDGVLRDPALRPPLADPCLSAPDDALPPGCDPIGPLVERARR